MPDKKKLIEHGKSLLIAVLLVSAVLLLHYTGYFSGAIEKMGLIIGGGTEISKAAEDGSGDRENHGLAQAMEISVSARDGHRYSSMYNADVVGEDYSRFSAFLAEALGSASACVLIDEAEWIRALEGESVYIRYFAPQSISFLSARLGTVFSSGGAVAMAEEFCLCCENGGVNLYYREGEAFYRCVTAVSDEALRERIGEYITNDSLFSYADKMLDGIKNSVLISRDFSAVPELKAGSVSSSQMLEPFMLALGINEYTASHYTEAGGTDVYVDGNSVLRIYPSGLVRYELSGESALKSSGRSMDSLLEFCWDIAQASVGKSCDGAELYMSSVEAGDNGDYTIYFDYLVEGIPVRNGNKHAAVFSFSSNALDWAEFYCRSYSLTGQIVQILPMYQAAAIASSKGCDQLSLVYSDTQEEIKCVWVNE